MKFNAILKTTTNLCDRGIEQIIALDLDGNMTLNKIVEKVFCLNEELLSLGKEISEKTLSTKISAYQAMFPKALKAKSKVNMGIVTETYCFLNKNIDVDEYINTHSRNKKEIEVVSPIPSIFFDYK